jgi:cation transport ATPase
VTPAIDDRRLRHIRVGLAIIGGIEAFGEWVVWGVVAKLTSPFEPLSSRIVDSVFLTGFAVVAGYPFYLAASMRPKRPGIAITVIIAMLAVNVVSLRLYLSSQHSTSGLLWFSGLAISWIVWLGYASMEARISETAP